MSMMINSSRFDTVTPSGVNWSPEYDDVTGLSPVGAWGVRRLVSGYSGSLIRIRDTTGGAEQDVGIGADGWLASFTVTGNAAVVTLYDQSGNGNHLTQSDTTKQPLLVRPGVSFSGWPAIRFDASNDFLHDNTTGTAKSYMVSYPVVALEFAGRGSGQNFSPMASVPHQAGVNTSPFYRWSIQKYSSTGDLEIRLSGSASATITWSSDVRNDKSIGLIMLGANADTIFDGRNTSSGPRAAGDTVTYPNATGLRLGANGAGAEINGCEITAVVILSDGTSSAATIAGWHDGILNKNLSKVDDKVLDVTFTGSVDPTDTSDRGHLIWLSDGATISGGYLDPTSTGAAVISQSGLTNPSADFTFECQIYPTSLITDRRIASKARGITSGWELSLHNVNSDEVMFIIGGNFIVTGEHGSQANIVTGSWQTVRVTRSGNTFKIYVDGVERASRTLVSSPTQVYIGNPLLIGNNSLRTQAFPGYIRNVKLWSGVATPP